MSLPRSARIALLATALLVVLPSVAGAHAGPHSGDLTCSPFAAAPNAGATAPGGQPFGLDDRADHRGATNVESPPATAAAVERTVGVWVHVIRKSDGTGGVSDALVQSQIDRLNAAFTDMTTFVLLGTTTSDNDAWYAMTMGSTQERQAKAALRRGSADDLNVYVPGPGQYAWATFPWSYARNPSDDGIVVRGSWLPSESYDGDIAVHETGHWMGLYHTFQGGCKRNGGDYVEDTPAEASGTAGCPAGRDSCPRLAGLDPTDNYMSYAGDGCTTRFTDGQYARMDSMWVQYRQNR